MCCAKTQCQLVMNIKHLSILALTTILVFTYRTSAWDLDRLAEESNPKVRRQIQAEGIDPCGDSSWTAYNDTKCYKVLPDLATADEALQLCIKAAGGDIYSPVISIHSTEEQFFLAKYIFETNRVTKNVWLGGERVNIGLIFEWNDHTAKPDRLLYSNWEPGQPTDDMSHGCLLMVPSGQWRDAACDVKNAVVCSKRQWLTGGVQNSETVRLAQEFSKVIPELDKKVKQCSKDHSDLEEKISKCADEVSKLGGNVEEGGSSDSNIEKDVQQCNMDVLELQSKIDSARQDVEDLQANPVPIGLIYVQLPKQKEPSEIWPNVMWTQVTEEYAGYFFRAEGGGSDEFGTDQSELFSYIFYIQTGVFGSSMNDSAYTKPGGYNTNSVFTGGDKGEKYGITWYMNDPENRPRNTAIRIWTRTE